MIYILHIGDALTTCTSHLTCNRSITVCLNIPSPHALWHNKLRKLLSNRLNVTWFVAYADVDNLIKYPNVTRPIIPKIGHGMCGGEVGSV